ncbi:MAG: Na+/H+ antiporter NhaC family protein [Bacteroidaceae bacterium]|nr:Na+/H+ antiporter NhaC family protein [Bacteroidaceae bacterium]
MATKIVKPRLSSLSPMFLLVTMIVGLSLYFGDFYKVPLVVLFLITSIFSLFTLKGMTANKRIEVFSKGAGQSDLMLMIWIFILAGAFAQTAKEMGAVDATVNLTLHFLPANMMLPGVFVAACLISLSIGTSVGTIAALVPIMTALANKTEIDPAMLTAATVGGAFFGDNLSFISDTTVVATKTQGCKMSDKFKTNFLIVLPAAIITFAIYLFIGSGNSTSPTTEDYSLLKIIPYIAVLATAIAGLNVLIVLPIGIILCAIIGICGQDLTLLSFLDSAKQGIYSMNETMLIALLAGGLLAVVREAGGIDYIINKLSSHSGGKIKAQLSVATLVSLTNLCTANNTVAILSVGSIAKDISFKFNINPRKTASILDTFSCFVQGIIPYGAQLLIASSLAGISAMSLMPYLFYPYLIGVSALLSILTNYPKIKNNH